MNGGHSSGRDDRQEAASKILSVQGGQPPDRLRMIRRLELACALTLTVLIIFLHGYRVSRAGALWRDEVSALTTATFPSLSQVWFSLPYECCPLLTFGVVRTWTGISWLGSSDSSLRVLGALIGVGVLLVLWVNQRLLGYQVPLLGLVLFGMNPTVIQWGDSLRGYGLGSLLILLVYGLVWKVVESPTPGRVVLAALASILSVQSLYQNAFLLLAICLGGLVVCLRKRMWKRILIVLGIGAISALSLTPYLPTITTAQELLIVGRAPYDFAHLLNVFATALSSNTSFALWAWFIGCGIGLVAAAYLVILAPTNGGYEGRSDLAIFTLTVLVIGTASFFFFLKRTNLPTQPWYYIVLMGLIALSVEVLIELVATTNPWRIGRLVVAVSVAYVSIPIAWQQLSIRQTNVDIVAVALKERASQGDVIVVNPWYMGMTFRHYYRGETAWSMVPPIRESRLARYDLLKEQMAMENPLQPVFHAIEKSLSSGNRVWWVGSFLAPPVGELPPSLPPAPNGPGGWYFLDYENAWTLQLGHFIQSHTLDREPVNLPIHQPVSPYENLPLLVFKGWRP